MERDRVFDCMFGVPSVGEANGSVVNRAVDEENLVLVGILLSQENNSSSNNIWRRFGKGCKSRSRIKMFRETLRGS